MPTVIIDGFIRSEILAPELIFQQADDFRTHIDLLLDAAQDRGWETVVMGPGVTGFYDKSGTIVGTLQQMITSATSSSAVSICARKEIAKEHFRRAGVPVAEGRSFLIDDKEAAVDYFLSCAGSVVVKPDRGSGGTNVITGIQSLEDFERAWSVVAQAGNAGGVTLVEEQFSGIDIRVLVVGGKYVAASSRVPGFVIGDGEKTFDELVSSAQEMRNSNAYLKRMSIKPDYAWLKGIGIERDTVLEKGRIQILSLVYNLHQGGVNVDVTERLPGHFISMAEDAAKSVPGLAVAGIDLMVSGLCDHSEGIVLEANTAANIAVHHYPAYGAPQSAADAIIELLAEQAL